MPAAPRGSRHEVVGWRDLGNGTARARSPSFNILVYRPPKSPNAAFRLSEKRNAPESHGFCEECFEFGRAHRDGVEILLRALRNLVFLPIRLPRLGFEQKSPARDEQLIHLSEQAANALVAPVQMYPFRHTQTKNGIVRTLFSMHTRICGNKVQASKLYVEGEG